jgi:hypothetical protein
LPVFRLPLLGHTPCGTLLKSAFAGEKIKQENSLCS